MKFHFLTVANFNIHLRALGWMVLPYESKIWQHSDRWQLRTGKIKNIKKDLVAFLYFYISPPWHGEVKQVFSVCVCIICVVYNVPRRRKLLPPFLILLFGPGSSSFFSALMFWEPLLGVHGPALAARRTQRSSIAMLPFKVTSNYPFFILVKFVSCKIKYTIAPAQRVRVCVCLYI
jgi:hypothetical protein